VPIPTYSGGREDGRLALPWSRCEPRTRDRNEESYTPTLYRRVHPTLQRHHLILTTGSTPSGNAPAGNAPADFLCLRWTVQVLRIITNINLQDCVRCVLLLRRSFARCSRTLTHRNFALFCWGEPPRCCFSVGPPAAPRALFFFLFTIAMHEELSWKTSSVLVCSSTSDAVTRLVPWYLKQAPERLHSLPTAFLEFGLESQTVAVEHRIFQEREREREEREREKEKERARDETCPCPLLAD